MENVPTEQRSTNSIEFSTPPRQKKIISIQRQAKLLTSEQIEQRFSPSQQRRRHLRLLQINDKIEPARSNPNKDRHPKMILDKFLFDSLKKTTDDHSFTVPEKILKEKLENLLEKNVA